VVSEEKLVESLGMNEGLVILTHEHNTERLQQLFGAQRIVLGIREAKGLEFPDVAVVDFFSSMTREDQLRWREMMVMDEDELQESGQRRGVDLRYKFPELETQLKLLYTAITRSERSLYLIETKRSVAGAAFFAHVRDRGLAQVQELLSSDAVLLTHDEWVSRGLDFAMAAKETAHIEDELTWLRRAIQCFDCADNAEMRRRARAHWASALLRKKLLESASKDQALEADAEADVEAEFTVELEMEAMRVIRGCITSSMLREAVEVCQVVLPLLTPRSQQLLTEVLKPLLALIEGLCNSIAGTSAVTKLQ
jgi:ATP-dependent exoDNAse (exonuclease V) beta subunit